MTTAAIANRQGPRRRRAARAVVSHTVKYKRVLVRFMGWKDSTSYENDHEFSTNALAAITPEEIARWFKTRAYGNPDADPSVDRPTMRARTFLYDKKALSHFMPDRRMEYNELSRVGNPTRSTDVNDLIAAIKRKEAARLGAPSQARRALFASEFEQAITMMESPDDNNDREMAAFLSALLLDNSGA